MKTAQVLAPLALFLSPYLLLPLLPLQGRISAPVKFGITFRP